MAQTIEGFVGNALDEAKISPLHVKSSGSSRRDISSTSSISRCSARSIPYMLQSKFATGAEAAAIGSATIFGMFIGTAGQGEFSDRFGRRFIYQFNLLLFGVFTILGALRAERHAAGRLPLHRRASASAPSSRSPSPMPANIRPSAFAAASWRSFISSAARAYGRSAPRCAAVPTRSHSRRCLARRLAGHRHRRADRLGVPLHAAGIAALSGDARQRQRSSRFSSAWASPGRPSRSRPTPRATPRVTRSPSSLACSRSASSPA